ncbi:unnamed protein product [Coffea canephora]|uniref:CCR4-Not complex component Not1 C-terminal domain-containing protein n=1 Tax=Coffea canephora TaxID=49390 RepID=A0A068UTS1_COFCA|nr:unnamed protein product [Coffea canephora]
MNSLNCSLRYVLDLLQCFPLLIQELITFIELIKNPRYNFWSRTLTRCAPEIENLHGQGGKIFILASFFLFNFSNG